MPMLGDVGPVSVTFKDESTGDVLWQTTMAVLPRTDETVQLPGNEKTYKVEGLMTCFSPFTAGRYEVVYRPCVTVTLSKGRLTGRMDGVAYT